MPQGQSYGVQVQEFVPAGVNQRLGETQVLDIEYYYTLLYGVGQTLQAENVLFADTQGNNENLTNMRENGRFADEKQFMMYCFSCMVWNGTNPDFYDQFIYHSRVQYEYQDALKQIIWLDHAPAAGGVSGYDQGAGAFHITNGVASQGNCWQFAIPMLITPSRTFRLKHKFMTGRFGAAPDPLTYVNVTDAASDRTVRFYIRGLEGRDLVNG